MAVAASRRLKNGVVCFAGIALPSTAAWRATCRWLSVCRPSSARRSGGRAHQSSCASWRSVQPRAARVLATLQREPATLQQLAAAGLSAERVSALFEPSSYLGSTHTFIERALAAHRALG